MLIAILNQSTLVSNGDAAAMTQAIAAQVRLDVAPLWDRAPAAVIFFIPTPRMCLLRRTASLWSTPFLISPRVCSGTTRRPRRQTVGRGRGQTRTRQRRKSRRRATGVLPASCRTKCWKCSSTQTATCGPTTAAGKAYSFEVCDPVEAPTYPVNGVSVSNFVTPAWFDPLSDHATAQYDKLGELHAPFSILKGGYVVYEAAGAEHSGSTATLSRPGANR